MSLELQQLLAETKAANEKIAAIRADLDTTKASDALSKEKLAKMEKDLADTLAAKQAAELTLKAVENRLAEVETKANRPGSMGGAALLDEHKAALVAFLRAPEDAKAQADLASFQAKAAEFNSLTGIAGGLAIPKQVATDIAKVAMDLSPIRQIARVVTVGTTDYSELVDLNGAGFEWVGETDVRNQTNTPNLGEAKPIWGMIAAKPEATIESIQDGFFDVEAWLIDSVVRQFAIAEGQAFVSGNGVKKPMGFLNGAPVATADATRAFGVLQFLVTGQAAALGAAPFDPLYNLVFGTKAEYRANARFVLNSLTLAGYAKVKNANGDYIFQPSPVAGTPDRLLGYGTTIAEDMPNVAADAFPVAFGDFNRGYLIADRAGLTVIRDPITKPGYVRFQLFRRVGGCLKDTNAIKLLKVAA